MEPADPAARDVESPDPLVIAARSGDADAVAQLYRREHGTVWRLCFGFLAERTEADDAAQDAMLKLLDTLDLYDPARPFPSWRNTVVLNLCRDRLRRHDARARAESEAAARELPARLPDPADEAQHGEVRELVAASLSRLTPREREVFVLHDLEGEAAAAVAATLDIAPSTVRVLLMTARRRLREILAPRLALGTARGGARP
jgi:RNA polymerase sigma-70 factor (ECF subfamily)